jgi:hypothetical protein
MRMGYGAIKLILKSVIGQPHEDVKSKTGKLQFIIKVTGTALI